MHLERLRLDWHWVMSDPNPDGSDPEQVDALIGRLKDERLRYRNLPRESAVQIIEEAAGKLLSLPGVIPLEERAISLADSGIAALVMALPLPPVVNVEVAAGAAKGVDLVLHGVVAWLQHKWQAEQAAADAERKR